MRGLYLKPPSVGGLWDGVITIPSARSSGWEALYVRIAWDSAGVGVNPSRASSSVCTPLAASTCSAVSCAGPDSAWVSLPMNSGPVMPCPARYSTIACVIAAMWSSLNEVFSEEPRCPEVPNATRWSGFPASGARSKYAATRSSMSTRSLGWATVPARLVMPPNLVPKARPVRPCAARFRASAPPRRTTTPHGHLPRAEARSGDEAGVRRRGRVQLGGQREQLRLTGRAPHELDSHGDRTRVVAGLGVRHVVGTVIAGSPITFTTEVHGVYWHWRM